MELGEWIGARIIENLDNRRSTVFVIVEYFRKLMLI